MKIDKKKIVIICIIFIICLLTVSQTVQAQNMGEGTEEKTFNPEEYKPTSTSSVSGATRLEEIGNDIIGIVQVIGSISSVVALILIGIKYIMGSVEEKAEYKETLKPYLIGAIMLFGITNLLGIVQSIVSGF